MITVKTKVGRAHRIVSANTPIAHLVCYGRQNGGLYPPLFLQCMITFTWMYLLGLNCHRTKLTAVYIHKWHHVVDLTKSVYICMHGPD